jgi:hypothetical protein
LGRLVALQAHLLGSAAELVRPGGFLFMPVCSLLAERDAVRPTRSGAPFSLGQCAAGISWRQTGRGRAVAQPGP